MQSQICGPLGLTGTAVMQGADVGLPFYHEGMGLNVPQILASMGPDGGIVSTLDEVLIFLRAFTEGQLFDLRNIPLMQQWNRLFYPLEYGYGLMRIKLPRWMTPLRASPELIGHSGSRGTFAFHAPESDIYLLRAFNQTDAPRCPFGFMQRVLGLVAKHKGAR